MVLKKIGFIGTIYFGMYLKTYLDIKSIPKNNYKYSNMF